MRSHDDRVAVLRFAASGLTDAAVSERTGVPATTVGRWRRESDLPARRRGPQPLPPPPLLLDGAPYSYLLGMYREIVDRFPEQFLRGLIHSDGCRTINRFTTKLPSGRVAEYEYPRYFFSNLSPDIRGLFCEYCDRLGIRWSLSNPRNVSVSHRTSVAMLDEFVGPKS